MAEFTADCNWIWVILLFPPLASDQSILERQIAPLGLARNIAVHGWEYYVSVAVELGWCYVPMAISADFRPFGDRCHYSDYFCA